ncbi:hypothetical protein MLD52_12200 [Puniceicoccaceae bacterium K14]|nr:hypothetical protein [Puniceicoccaceae bacterium K14]
MTSNLIFYGSNLGLGFIFSFFFWEKEERNTVLYSAAILIPVFWTLTLAAGKNTLSLIELYDYGRMNYSFTKNRVTFWIVPMFWAMFVFGCVWIEKNQLKSEN